jgi:hypothetical protein
MYPEPTMIQSGYSKIKSFISNDDIDSVTESDSSWGGPENQLGLEPREHIDSQGDVEEVDLDEGEIKHHEVIAKY